MTKNKIKLVVLILLLSSLVITLWHNRSRLSAENVTTWIEGRFLSIGIGDGYPSEIRGNNVEPSNFLLIDDNIAMLSNTSLTVFNGTAKEMTNRAHNLSNPMMKVNGGRAILYDMGGNKYSVDTISKNIRSCKSESAIMSGDVSENGVYGLVTESVDYLSEMTIYNKNGSEKYKYYFSEYYISDISINRNGTNAVVSGVASKNGGLKSIVYVFDFKSDVPKMTFEYDENMIMCVEFMENGNICVIGDKSAGVINMWTGKKQDFDYDAKILTCYNVNKYEGIQLSLSSVGEGQNCEIVLLDRNGNTILKIPTEYSILSITSRGSRVAGVSEDKVFLYKTSGELQGDWVVANNIKKVQLKSRSEGYVLGVNKVYKLKLK